MAISKKKQILAAIMCASVITTAYPTVSSAADSISSNHASVKTEGGWREDGRVTITASSKEFINPDTSTITVEGNAISIQNKGAFVVNTNDFAVESGAVSKVKSINGSALTFNEDQITAINGVTLSVRGLSNTAWDADNIVADRAATEGQLNAAVGNLNQEISGSYVAYDKTDNTVNKESVTFNPGGKGTKLNNVAEIIFNGSGNNMLLTGTAGGKATITDSGNSIVLSTLGQTGNRPVTTISGTNEAISIGNSNTITVDKNSAKYLEYANKNPSEKYWFNGNVAIGTEVALTNSGESVGLGSSSIISDTIAGSAVGYASKVDNSDHGVALGGWSKVSYSNGGIAIGSQSSVLNAKKSVAIGANAYVEGANSIALGANSVALDDNIVSVGNEEVKRKIVNVADGVDNNDAATVGQLNKATYDTQKIRYDKDLDRTIVDGTFTNIYDTDENKTSLFSGKNGIIATVQDKNSGNFSGIQISHKGDSIQLASEGNDDASSMLLSAANGTDIIDNKTGTSTNIKGDAITTGTVNNVKITKTDDGILLDDVNINDIKENTQHITHNTDKDYTAVEGTKFYQDGKIENQNGSFAVDNDSTNINYTKIEKNGGLLDGVTTITTTNNKTDVNGMVNSYKEDTSKKFGGKEIVKSSTNNTIGLDKSGVSLSAEASNSVLGIKTTDNKSNLNVAADGINLSAANGISDSTAELKLTSNGLAVNANGSKISASKSGVNLTSGVGVNIEAGGSTVTTNVLGTQFTNTKGISTINGNTIKAGLLGVTIDGGAKTVTGLSNTTWDENADYKNSNKAATEGQLYSVSDRLSQTEAEAKNHTVVKGSDNITATKNPNNNEYTVALKDDVNIKDSLTVGTASPFGSGTFKVDSNKMTSSYKALGRDAEFGVTADGMTLSANKTTTGSMGGGKYSTDFSLTAGGLNINTNGSKFSAGESGVKFTNEDGGFTSISGSTVKVGKFGVTIDGETKTINNLSNTEWNADKNYAGSKQAATESQLQKAIKASQVAVAADEKHIDTSKVYTVKNGTVSLTEVDGKNNPTGNTVEINDVASAKELGEVKKDTKHIKHNEGTFFEKENTQVEKAKFYSDGSAALNDNFKVDADGNIDANHLKITNNEAKIGYGGLLEPNSSLTVDANGVVNRYTDSANKVDNQVAVNKDGIVLSAEDTAYATTSKVTVNQQGATFTNDNKGETVIDGGRLSTEDLTVNGNAYVQSGNSQFLVNEDNVALQTGGNGLFADKNNATLTANGGSIEVSANGTTVKGGDLRSENDVISTDENGKTHSLNDLAAAAGDINADIDGLKQKTSHIIHNEAEGYTSVEGTKFYNNGNFNATNESGSMIYLSDKNAAIYANNNKISVGEDGIRVSGSDLVVDKNVISTTDDGTQYDLNTTGANTAGIKRENNKTSVEDLLYVDGQNGVVTIGSGTKGITFDAKNRTVGNLGNTTWDNSKSYAGSGLAATESQLAQVEKNIKDELGKVDDSAVKYDSEAKDKVTLNGENGTTISNVADGVDDKDAVNKGQLDAVDKKVEDLKADVGDVDNIAGDIQNKDGSTTSVVDGLNNLNQKVDDKIAGVTGDLSGVKTDVNALKDKTTDITYDKETGTTVGGTEFNNGNVTTDGTVTAGNIVSNGDVTTASGASLNTVNKNVGDLSKLDTELTDNQNYKDNQNLVGGLNAEADIRRSEVSRLDNRVDALDSRVGSLEDRVGDVEDRIDKVGAMAAAIANLRTMGYDPQAPTEIAIGVGQYKSETGLALGVFHYPNEDFMLSFSISTSSDEVMGGIGATWKLGRKSPKQKAEIEAKHTAQKAEELKAAAKAAEVKAQQERHAKLLAEKTAETK